MILFGDGECILGFDIEERHFCECCKAEQDFTIRLKYRYGHFYHLFGWVIEKQYQLVCPTCTHGWLLNGPATEARLGFNPIPFRQRNGWIVGIVLILAATLGALLLPGAPEPSVQPEQSRDWI